MDLATSNPTHTQNSASRQPFRDPTADIILRSCDDFDFHVHRLVLALASPVFEHMFTSPQPEAKSETPSIIHMAESGAVLERILAFWYPGAEPVVENLGQLREILELLINKYDMRSIGPLGKQYLRGYVESDPLGSFGVAARHGWHDLALMAARECLKHPLRTSTYIAPAEWDTITVSALHSLLQYHYQCGEAAVEAGTNLSWLDDDFSLQNPTDCSCPRTTNTRLKNGHKNLPVWLVEFVKDMGHFLQFTPGARDRPLISKALQEAAKCKRCHKYSCETLPTWISSKWSPYPGRHGKGRIEVERLK
ncbi:hypothetical protein B0H19DRAFT_708544 [Mycena capillaripes]|nr:hypothetical protein B0H19DRAFT_708544 [Mycena capillaripes]